MSAPTGSEVGLEIRATATHKLAVVYVTPDLSDFKLATLLRDAAERLDPPR
jgi:hypothetical protein